MPEKPGTKSRVSEPPPDASATCAVCQLAFQPGDDLDWLDGATAHDECVNTQPDGGDEPTLSAREWWALVQDASWDLLTGKALEPYQVQALRPAQAGAFIVLALSATREWWALVRDASGEIADDKLRRRIGLYGNGRRRPFFEELLRAAVEHYPDERRARGAMLAQASIAVMEGAPGRGLVRQPFVERSMLAAETIARRGAGRCVCCDKKLPTADPVVWVTRSVGEDETSDYRRRVRENACEQCSSTFEGRDEAERREKAEEETFAEIVGRWKRLRASVRRGPETP